MSTEDCKDNNSSASCVNGHLLPSMLSRKALLSFFGEYNQGKFVLDIILRISVTTLISYPGENDLQVQVATPLLSSCNIFITLSKICFTYCCPGEKRIKS